MNALIEAGMKYAEEHRMRVVVTTVVVVVTAIGACALLIMLARQLFFR